MTRRPAYLATWSGGFLDTVVEGRTGLFFGQPSPGAIGGGLRRLQRTTWDPRAPVAHASIFVEARFVEALRATSFAAATGSGPRELYGSAR
ncbi:MAG: hypothetical protein H0V50_06850 [Thermoleophilaceae bacterium]|nr:hypothetical protein [Thermoleophilaceae bacterium]